jgi:hypothetical protein
MNTTAPGQRRLFASLFTLRIAEAQFGECADTATDGTKWPALTWGHAWRFALEAEVFFVDADGLGDDRPGHGLEFSL